MSSEFQKRYAPGRLAEDLRRQTPAPAEPPPEAEAAAEPEAVSVSHLGTERNRKVRLELRFKNGTAKAINYGDIALMNYDPEKGIVLDLPPFRVRLEGVALAPLFRGLVSERVSFVAEVDPFTAAARRDDRPAVFLIAFEKWSA